MKKKVGMIIMSFVLSIVTGLGQSLPSKQQQYNFLKWYLKADTIRSKNLVDTLDHPKHPYFTSANLIALEEEGVHLSKSDKMFIQKQLATNRRVKYFDKKLLSWGNWKLASDNKTPANYLSLPVFNSSGKLALIYWRYDCRNPYLPDNSDGINVYKKVKGKWQSSNSIKSVFMP